MKNDQWDQTDILPQEMMQDLSSLRDSIDTNEVLRAKLRKQLLSNITTASPKRSPQVMSRKKRDAWIWGGLSAVVALVLIIGIWQTNRAISGKDRNLKAVQQIQAAVVPANLSESTVTVSRDKRFLAYEKDNTIWIQGIDGGHSQELLPAPIEGYLKDPSFSPDGTVIAVSIGDRSQASIGTISFQTRTVKTLTKPPAGFSDIHPVYSRDGKYMAFIRVKLPEKGESQNLAGELWTVKADGTSPKKVTDHAMEPTWSPKGDMIAFSRPDDNEKLSALFLITKNGSNEKRIGEGRSPAWSPSGKYIAYVNAYATYKILQKGTDGKPIYQVKEQRQEIWVMDKNGDHPTRLTNVSVQSDGDEQKWMEHQRKQGTAEPQTLVEQGNEQDSSPIWTENEQTLLFVSQYLQDKKGTLQQLILQYEQPMYGGME